MTNRFTKRYKFFDSREGGVYTLVNVFLIDFLSKMPLDLNDKLASIHSSPNNIEKGKEYPDISRGKQVYTLIVISKCFSF